MYICLIWFCFGVYPSSTLSSQPHHLIGPFDGRHPSYNGAFRCVYCQVSVDKWATLFGLNIVLFGRSAIIPLHACCLQLSMIHLLRSQGEGDKLFINFGSTASTTVHKATAERHHSLIGGPHKPQILFESFKQTECILKSNISLLLPLSMHQADYFEWSEHFLLFVVFIH